MQTNRSNAKKILCSVFFIYASLVSSSTWALNPRHLIGEAQFLFSEIAERFYTEGSWNAYTTAYYLNAGLDYILSPQGRRGVVPNLSVQPLIDESFEDLDHTKEDRENLLKHLDSYLLNGAPMTEEGQKKIIIAFVKLFEIELLHFEDQFTSALQVSDESMFRIWESEMITAPGMQEIFTVLGEEHINALVNKYDVRPSLENFMAAMEALVVRSEGSVKRYAARTVFKYMLFFRTAKIRRAGTEVNIPVPFPVFFREMSKRLMKEKDPIVAKTFKVAASLDKLSSVRLEQMRCEGALKQKSKVPSKN